MTHKELLLLQDNISMCQDTQSLIQTCYQVTNDPQLKNICQQMMQDHKQGLQQLSRHITQMNVQ